MRAQMLCQNIMGLYSSPLRIVVAMGLLYSQLGAASLVALGTLILFMPLQVRPTRLQLEKRASLLLGSMRGAKCTMACVTCMCPGWNAEGRRTTVRVL